MSTTNLRLALATCALGSTLLGACGSNGGSTTTAPPNGTMSSTTSPDSSSMRDGTMHNGTSAGAANTTITPAGASGNTNAASGSGAMAPTGSSGN